MSDDTRVVFSVRCSWWDGIDKVGKKTSGLPCCPYCGSVLMEMDSEEEWWKSAENYAAKENQPDYVEFIKWLRGKCYKNLDMAKEGYLASLVTNELETPDGDANPTSMS